MKIITIFVLAALLFLPAMSHAQSEDPKARELMQKVHDRDDGDNAVMEQTMILIDKRGKERVRKIKSFGKDFGKDTYSVMFFLEPADVRDTAFLTYDYDSQDKDDDQWLYLPALKKVKRIASKDKDGAFMGSDFTYGDMTKRELKKFSFKLLEEKEVNGQKCWIIESLPINNDVVDEYGYTKSVIFVRQDNFVVPRAVFWINKGDKLRYYEVQNLKKIDGVWTVMECTMTTKEGENTVHKTILKTDKALYNQKMDKGMFTTNRMEKGL